MGSLSTSMPSMRLLAASTNPGLPADDGICPLVSWLAGLACALGAGGDFLPVGLLGVAGGAGACVGCSSPCCTSSGDAGNCVNAPKSTWLLVAGIEVRDVLVVTPSVSVDLLELVVPAINRGGVAGLHATILLG